MPSRESTSKPLEETAHTATISTADKGNHASLCREDEDAADPVPGDAKMRTVGPDRDRDQGPTGVLADRSPVRMHACIR